MKIPGCLSIFCTALLASCSPAHKPTLITPSAVKSMDVSTFKTYNEICEYLWNHPSPVSLAELLRNPSTFDKDVVMVTGRYIASDTRSELRLDHARYIWLDMPYNEELNRKLVTVSGTFTAMSTAPGRPAATICAVSHISEASR